MVLNEQDFRDLVKTQMFGVTFIKKDGSLRNMNCRLSVKKHLQGGQLSFEPSHKNLMVVYELGNGYRMIPMDDRMLELRFDGMKLDFRQ